MSSVGDASCYTHASAMYHPSDTKKNSAKNECGHTGVRRLVSSEEKWTINRSEYVTGSLKNLLMKGETESIEFTGRNGADVVATVSEQERFRHFQYHPTLGESFHWSIYSGNNRDDGSWNRVETHNDSKRLWEVCEVREWNVESIGRRSERRELCRSWVSDTRYHREMFRTNANIFGVPVPLKITADRPTSTTCTHGPHPTSTYSPTNSSYSYSLPPSSSSFNIFLRVNRAPPRIIHPSPSHLTPRLPLNPCQLEKDPESYLHLFWICYDYLRALCMGQNRLFKPNNNQLPPT